MPIRFNELRWTTTATTAEPERQPELALPEPDPPAEIPGPIILAHARNSFHSAGSALTNDIFESEDAVRLYAQRIYNARLKDRAALHRWLKTHDLMLRPATWQEREHSRFVSGAYHYPVWDSEGWWQRFRHYGAPGHYAHISMEDPNMVAFTESPEKGERDIQTRMKPGRYLKKFLGPDSAYVKTQGYEGLTDKQVAYYAEWQQRGARPELDVIKTAKLKFATTEDDIERVYRKGPRSCMDGHHGDGGRWPDGEHPCRIYAAGDLAVAYLETTDGKIAARQLVWPAKKVMGRAYPSESNYDSDGWASQSEALSVAEALADRLKKDGYTSFYEDQRLFDGARLIKREWPSGEYVMPYLDGTGVCMKDDHFVIAYQGYDYSGNNTDGTLTGDSTGNADDSDCERCGDGIDDGDECHVFTETSSGGFGIGSANWCQECYDNHAFYCDATDASFDINNVEYVVMSNGNTWNGQYFANMGFTCEYDGESYPNREQSDRFPGYHKQYDDDPEAHPELSEDQPDAEIDAPVEIAF